jgi:prepilin-type N-terminal cleavage/methylation domain-containing protein/prepilin-type processing-associated H-X9-DG protein
MPLSRPAAVPRRHRPGFTLIELLVVVAIISLLISILTPSLSRARQQAKSTVCLARLNELVKCTTAYTNDHAFALPLTDYDVVDPANPSLPPARHGWAELLYVYTYRDRDFEMREDFPVQRNNYGKHELWVCKDAQPLTNSTGHYRVYDVAWRSGTIDQVKLKLPLITDANPVVTDPDDLRRADIPRQRIAGILGEAYIDERHYGGANYVFSDGHAERSTNLKQRLALDWDLDPTTPNQ